MHLFRSQGFSLLEVLVACLILSLGLLGSLGIYIHSFKRMKESHRQTKVFSTSVSMKEKGQECLDSDKRCLKL